MTPIPLDRYLEASRKLDLAGIDWGLVRDHPLEAAARECLVYMADIEGYTIAYLKDLLNTSAIDDPDIARFMSVWAYEEMFHAEALQRFLLEHGITFERGRRARLRRAAPLADRLAMAGASALSRLTHDFIAVHMAWGALNELTTLTAYERLAQRAGHPILTELLARIVKDERRHFSFYYQQAEARLERKAARWLTGTLLRRFWRPVGSGVKSLGEMYATIGYCYHGASGRQAARDCDAKMARLPGLEGFRMCEDVLDELATARRSRRR